MGLPPGEGGPWSPGGPPGPGAGGDAGPGTGDDRVDAALRRLTDLDGLPVAEHPAVFEHVHERLAGALGDLEAGGGPGHDAGRPAAAGPAAGPGR